MQHLAFLEQDTLDQKLAEVLCQLIDSETMNPKTFFTPDILFNFQQSINSWWRSCFPCPKMCKYQVGFPDGGGNQQRIQGGLGARAPPCHQDFLESCSFQAILRENPLF